MRTQLSTAQASLKPSHTRHLNKSIPLKEKANRSSILSRCSDVDAYGNEIDEVDQLSQLNIEDIANSKDLAFIMG